MRCRREADNDGIVEGGQGTAGERRELVRAGEEEGGAETVIGMNLEGRHDEGGLGCRRSWKVMLAL